jgi:hypothetical protein
MLGVTDEVAIVLVVIFLTIVSGIPGMITGVIIGHARGQDAGCGWGLFGGFIGGLGGTLVLEAYRQKYGYQPSGWLVFGLPFLSGVALAALIVSCVLAFRNRGRVREQTMPRQTLIQNLQTYFPNRGMRIGAPPSPCALFPGIHPEVGDVEVYDDGDELTVVLGKFTHAHFSNHDEALSPQQKDELISKDVASFLEKLFADQIVMWGSHEGAGGWYDRGDASMLQKDAKGYVWSGPVK